MAKKIFKTIALAATMAVTPQLNANPENPENPVQDQTITTAGQVKDVIDNEVINEILSNEKIKELKEQYGENYVNKIIYIFSTELIPEIEEAIQNTTIQDAINSGNDDYIKSYIKNNRFQSKNYAQLINTLNEELKDAKFTEDMFAGSLTVLIIVLGGIAISQRRKIKDLLKAISEYFGTNTISYKDAVKLLFSKKSDNNQ